MRGFGTFCHCTALHVWRELPGTADRPAGGPAGIRLYYGLSQCRQAPKCGIRTIGRPPNCAQLGSPPNCANFHNWAGAQLWNWGRPIVENEEAFENDAFDKDLVEPDKMTIQDPVEHILECYILKKSRC
jgi:hypothetical protein